MKAILPVAGNGTRMNPLNLTTPKALTPILNKPLIAWSIEALIRNQVNEIILVIDGGQGGEKIKNFVIGQNYDAKFHFPIEEDHLGTAHSLNIGRKLLEQEDMFIFLNGDDLYGDEIISELVASAEPLIVAKYVDNPERWGILKVHEDGYLKECIEKPQEYIGNSGNINALKLGGDIFRYYDQVPLSRLGEYLITDFFTIYGKYCPIKVIESSDFWVPISYPWQIFDAQEQMITDYDFKQIGEIESGAIIKGKVALGANSIIKSGACIEGDVIIGENCIIDANVRLNNLVVIGDNCNLHENAVISSTNLGNNVEVGESAWIGDSIISDDAQLGANFHTENSLPDNNTIQIELQGKLVDTGRSNFGAIIGAGVRTGADVKIMPGIKVWPNKTVDSQITVDSDIK